MKNLVAFAYIGAVIFPLTGIYFIMNSMPYSSILFVLGAICYGTFLIKAILEVSNSKNERANKMLWILGLIFMGSLVGLIYILTGRKRFVQNT
jgi:hypothetical protein